MATVAVGQTYEITHEKWDVGRRFKIVSVDSVGCDLEYSNGKKGRWSLSTLRDKARLIIDVKVKPGQWWANEVEERFLIKHIDDIDNSVTVRWEGFLLDRHLRMETILEVCRYIGEEERDDLIITTFGDAVDLNSKSYFNPEEKETMSYKPFERKELVLIKGQDASNLSDDQIFEVIQVIEAEIRGRAGVAGASKKQMAKIKELETAVSNIIDYVDNRDTE